MTIIEAINRADRLKPNTYSQQDKVNWLSTLDGIVKKEIIDTHEGGEDVRFELFGLGLDVSYRNGDGRTVERRFDGEHPGNTAAADDQYRFGKICAQRLHRAKEAVHIGVEADAFAGAVVT